MPVIVINTQDVSLYLTLLVCLEGVCLPSGFYSQEKLWTCWAGDKNDTEKIIFKNVTVIYSWVHIYNI